MPSKISTPEAPQIRRSRDALGEDGLPLEEPLQLGKKVREIRLANQLTLEEASRLTGLARSTLSKIENEQISPSFQAVQKLTAGLGIDIPQLFVPLSPGHGATGRRDITRAGEGQPHPTATYEHELLASNLSIKKMVPFKCRVRARSFEDFDDWVRHAGEEFLLVLEGQIEVYTEYYEPVLLNEGDSMYYDAAMGHCLVSRSKKDALALWVTAR
ncbi:helix-turn-helix domain-containing protein [Gilvimarinus sp. F26214L]|uniref:helix-turn-helix domain-containing protein n=1 Tax=Gilvimarinus sp. DZF01 TaxID=3461371 RepID=UPI004045CE9C